MLYISHRLDEVFRIAQRAVVLRDGRMVADFPRVALTRVRAGRRHGRRRCLEIGHRTARSRGAGRAARCAADLRVVEDLTFAVRTHEILAVYGVSGSGREGIGMAIIGASPVEVRDVEILGKQRLGRTRAAFDAGLGYVPAERRSQGLILIAIRENLTLAVLRTAKPRAASWTVAPNDGWRTAGCRRSRSRHPAQRSA